MRDVIEKVLLHLLLVILDNVTGVQPASQPYYMDGRGERTREMNECSRVGGEPACTD